MRRFGGGICNSDAICKLSGFRGGFVDRCDETVSPARNRLNESRVIGRIAESHAKFPYGRVDAFIEANEGIGRPNLGLQLFACNHLTGMLQE
jgi:hypothetical protein